MAETIHPEMLRAAGDEPTDYEWHAALASAIRRGAVTVDVEFSKINRNNVPGFRTTDFIVPPFALIVVSAYLAVQFGPIYGLALFVVGAAFILLLLRPRVREATVERVRKHSLEKLEAWNEIWFNGGYTLRLADRPDIECRGPDGDWVAFARQHTPARLSAP
ncbi:MAG: hypothetical protein WD044_08920 [Dongiaceae bacterium]